MLIVSGGASQQAQIRDTNPIQGLLSVPILGIVPKRKRPGFPDVLSGDRTSLTHVRMRMVDSQSRKEKKGMCVKNLMTWIAGLSTLS